MREKRFPVVLILVLLGIFYIGQGKWRGSGDYNPDVYKMSLTSFGLIELWNTAAHYQEMSEIDLRITSTGKFANLSIGAELPLSVIQRSIGKRIQARKFQSVTVDDNNVKWFITESGIVSYNGRRWSLHNKNKQVPGTNITEIEYMHTPSGRKLWLASPEGATLVSVPVGKSHPANTYNVDNSPLLSNNMLCISVDKDGVFSLSILPAIRMSIRYISMLMRTFHLNTPGFNIYMSVSALFIVLTRFSLDDGTNQPVGIPAGINPGRVVWVWNPDATNENCRSAFDAQDWYWKPENTDEIVVAGMFRDALKKLTGDTTVVGSWNRLFSYFNSRKSGNIRDYSRGEKIFIKINQGQARWILTQEEKDRGYYLPEVLNPSEQRRRLNLIPVETSPYIVLELLRELINELGIDQSDIAVGDPFSHIYGHNYDVWVKEFPDVIYVDRSSTQHGRTLIVPTRNDLIHFSDKSYSDKIYNVIEKADYIINVANLRTHGAALISLTAKNHMGSITSPTAKLLHHTHLARGKEAPAYEGYFKYRALVDIMGSRYLGQNTMLHIVDGLFGGGSDETKGPVKYFMHPFNNDWTNSIFISQDQVAIESVCYDFLREEWNGINKHDPINNQWEKIPDRDGIDDYLHQAADPANWPEGIIYDPDNTGNALTSLGVHEHWNDPARKQYSRNLGKQKGIELVSIPDSLVVTVRPETTQ